MRPNSINQETREAENVSVIQSVEIAETMSDTMNLCGCACETVIRLCSYIIKCANL